MCTSWVGLNWAGFPRFNKPTKNVVTSIPVQWRQVSIGVFSVHTLSLIKWPELMLWFWANQHGCGVQRWELMKLASVSVSSNPWRPTPPELPGHPMHPTPLGPPHASHFYTSDPYVSDSMDPSPSVQCKSSQGFNVHMYLFFLHKPWAHDLYCLKHIQFQNAEFILKTINQTTNNNNNKQTNKNRIWNMTV